MKNRPLLAVLLLLALPLALARRAPAAPPGPARGMPVPEPLPWNARGSPGAAAAAAAALELLREEGAGPPAAPQKRDMHDFFVGLMGKRAAEPGRAAGRGGNGGPAPRCSPRPPAPGEVPLRAA
nr:tachykinin-3 isoform X1 [Taeniopygia guttata]XP_041567565.1 tachykinin-3 isoform X1 [Taeniopygia guttata]